MTQRVFDIENEKDVQDLWDILPDKIKTIYKDSKGFPVYFINSPEIDGVIPCPVGLFKINWHGKTEITRPENYENMIGCVGWFSYHKKIKKDDMIFGILDAYNKNDNLGRCFYCHCDTWYKYFFPAKKCDVKFYGDKE